MLRLVFILSALVPMTLSFSTPFKTSNSRRSINMVAVADEKKIASSIEAPDFYWQFRLDRLASKKSAELAFSAKNYPDVSGFKDLYDAYYLDLTLQGLLEGFDWEAEKKLTDNEWQLIYKNISGWTKETAKVNKLSTNNLPDNDFDLLKQFYPQLNFRDLETPFAVEEVGANFPYRSMKDLLSAATNGKLNVPGYSSSITSIEATDAKKKLEALKESSFKKLDAILQDTLAYAQSPYPDEEAKKHYQALRAKLADFPQTSAGWATFRANMEKEVDEMARLASKKEEHHGHHGEEEEGHLSPAQEFEAKYGRNLDEMQERMSKFKADPKGFLEASILEKYGKNGLDIWKKSEEFSNQLSVITEADKTAAETAFSNFLKSA